MATALALVQFTDRAEGRLKAGHSVIGNAGVLLHRLPAQSHARWARLAELYILHAQDGAQCKDGTNLYRVDLSIDSPRHGPHAGREGCQVQHQRCYDQPVVMTRTAAAVRMQLLLFAWGSWALFIGCDADARQHGFIYRPTEGACLRWQAQESVTQVWANKLVV